MRVRKCRGPIVACGLALLIAAWAGADKALQKHLTGTLPSGKEIAGWTVMPGSLVYGEGKGLTEIYDGGYRQYLDNGVAAAARQVYQKSGMTADVVLHAMSSPAAGVKLAGIKRADFSRGTAQMLKTLPKGWGGFAVQDKGYAVSYVYSGKYLATVMVDGKQAKTATATEIAQKAVAKAMAADKGAGKAR